MKTETEETVTAEPKPEETVTAEPVPSVDEIDYDSLMAVEELVPGFADALSKAQPSSADDDNEVVIESVNEDEKPTDCLEI